MDNWPEIWERKGKSETSDLKELDGYEGTDFNASVVADEIRYSLGISKRHSILEIGCGAGAIAQHFKDYNYFGIDKSPAMISRFEDINGYNCLTAEANEIPFADESFDYVFSYSVFQYFPNRKYAFTVIREMQRVAKIAIFIGDLVEASRRDSHLMFNRNDPIFKWWNMSEGYYNPDRFNVWREV